MSQSVPDFTTVIVVISFLVVLCVIAFIVKKKSGHLKKIIKKVRHGTVRLVFHKPIEFNTCGDRKRLSYACYKAVKNGLVSPESSF